MNNTTMLDLGHSARSSVTSMDVACFSGSWSIWFIDTRIIDIAVAIK